MIGELLTIIFGFGLGVSFAIFCPIKFDKLKNKILNLINHKDCDL